MRKIEPPELTHLQRSLRFRPVRRVGNTTLFALGTKKSALGFSCWQDYFRSMETPIELYELADSAHPFIDFPLIRPMGFEFTFEKKMTWKDYRNSNYSYTHSQFFLRGMGIPVSGGDNDGCLEVHSPIMYWASDVVNYFSMVKKLLPESDFLTKNPWSTGGGMHIHVNLHPTKIGVKGEQSLLLGASLAKVCHNRPWLTPAFQNPRDDDSAEWISFSEFTKGSPHSPGILLGGNKHKAIRFDDDLNTMEFRFFDNPKDKTELVTFLKVANSLLELALGEEEKLVENPFLTMREDWEKFKAKVIPEYSNERFDERMKTFTTPPKLSLADLAELTPEEEEERLMIEIESRLNKILSDEVFLKKFGHLEVQATEPTGEIRTFKLGSPKFKEYIQAKTQAQFNFKVT